MPEWLIWSGVVWIHVVAAMAWVGGMTTIAVAVAPAYRAGIPESDRSPLKEIGRKAGVICWFSITLLVITGVANLVRLAPSWSSLTGKLLLAKLILAAIVVGITAVQDFVLRPRLTGSGRFERIHRPLSRGILGLSLLIVLLAVLVVRS